MDPRLLDYYNRELAYLREQGAEFAAQYPKVAARLTMHGIEVADPYVERLLEGVAFLTSRIQLKMDAEFPRFSQRLLDLAYPGYLAPTPATGIAQFHLRPGGGLSADGHLLPRLSRLRARMPASEQTPCEFRTAHELRLWPLRLIEARLTGAPPDLPVAAFRWSGPVRGALRLSFETLGDVPAAALSLDSLPIFMAGAPEVASRLQELIHTQCVGVGVHPMQLPVTQLMPLEAQTVRPEGYAAEQAMFPTASRAFEGYRLLHEYFAFPERFRFFSLNDLQRALKQFETQRFEVVLLLSQAAPSLEAVVNADHFQLHCAPVVNLFERRSDRIPVTTTRFEYHAVIDRSRPLDFEIHSVNRVTGHRTDVDDELVFEPLYAGADTDRRRTGAYYTVRREPRLLSEQSRRHGPRSGYIGSECFIAIVDGDEAPYPAELRQLTVEALCTNRDLALMVPVGQGDTDLSVIASAPVESVRFIAGPTRPTPAIAEREITWRLISHLSLNYLTLTDLDPVQGAAALRELLALYARLGAPGNDAQIAGLNRLAAVPINRRVPAIGPIVFGRGVQLRLELDELQFAGASPWILGAVLEQFFARHVSINSFTEFELASLQRGRIAVWAPRVGRRPIA
jgi:type VI secretion system protein ImpG